LGILPGRFRGIGQSSDHEPKHGELHHTFTASPARLFDERVNVVGWNESAWRVFGDYACLSGRERNAPWHHFMSPSARTLHVHWEREARSCIASLHARYDRHPDDRWLSELIAELQQASPEFRAWWPEHEIVLDCGGLYEINHPLVGRLALHPTVFPMPEQPDLEMIVYTPLDQEDTAGKLKALMSGVGQDGVAGHTPLQGLASATM
jgi:hypothetical protein